MPRTKTGEKITWKEFFTRWKQGIENISSLQKLKSETRGTFITLMGMVFSLFAVIWFREKIGLLAYGLILIFLGTSITTGLKWLSLRQQLKMLKDMLNDMVVEE